MWHLALAILPPVLCFVVSGFYLDRWTREMDDANRSISENGGPSVVYLSMVQEDLRRIERQAMLARPETVREDRAAIAALEADLAAANAAYRETPDYPGELEAYERAAGERAQFLAAVDRLLSAVAGAEGGRTEAAAGALVVSTADTLAESMRQLVKINADGVVIANAVAGRLRSRTIWLTNARDALAFAFVVAGSLLGFHGAHREAAFAEERRRLDQRHLDELDTFSGRVAHDLRDLLEVILMRAGIGARAQTLEECRKAHTLVIREAQRMSEVMRALLELARAAGEPAPGARCEPAAVVRQVVAEVQHLAATEGVEIVVEPMPVLMAACDASVLSVVVSNLLRNAVKYIGDGRGGVRRITLRGRVEDGRLRVEVEDTGPGLPPGAEAQVFSPLVRLAPAKGKPGIGLGLATVKRLIEANGGHVGVTSPPGAGARFWFTLPLR
jgi:signal transduction histidine kinase